MRRAPSGAGSVRLEVTRSGDVVHGEDYGAASPLRTTAENTSTQASRLIYVILVISIETSLETTCCTVLSWMELALSGSREILLLIGTCATAQGIKGQGEAQ